MQLQALDCKGWAARKQVHSVSPEETLRDSNQVSQGKNSMSRTRHEALQAAGAMSAIIAARGDNFGFNSRGGNDGGTGRAVFRHATRRFWRPRDQGGAEGKRRPVPHLGSPVLRRGMLDIFFGQ